MMRFNRKPKDPNAIEPTKLNSSKVIVNLQSGNSKKVTKAMLEGFKTRPYDKDIYFVFGSGLEAKYYTQVLLPKINAGEIVVEFQPKFEVWPKVDKEGVKHLAITYSPDFAITPVMNNVFGGSLYGRTYYVDVKGMANETFPLKHKLFDGAFPDLPPLVVMKFYQRGGGWLTLQEFNAVKKAEKKTKKLAEVKEA